MRVFRPELAMRAAAVTAVVIFGLTASGLFSRGNPDAPATTTLQPTDPRPYGLGNAPFAQVSSASCAAAACHGGGQPGRVGSEHSTWAATVTPGAMHDPHAYAYRVLFNADSTRIGKLLGIAEPYKDALCLKCHAVDGVRPGPAVSEGVGCGACHGPAEKWLAAHVEPGWKSLSNRTKWEAYGFVPAGNMVARSLNCVGCHVGDADREVNHDLIAAGHPRLNFEYTRFHFNPKYRQHWVEKTPQPDFEVRAWVIGQAATLRAATDLLRVRAERAGQVPWPEFSGYSCYSCHQTVGSEEVRRNLSTTRRPPGQLGWELWSAGTVRVASEFATEAFRSAGPIPLDKLSALQDRMGTTHPDPVLVKSQAESLVKDLDRWLAAAQAEEDAGKLPARSAGLPASLLRRIAGDALAEDGKKLADHDWDYLATHYLGCAAMYHASGGQVAGTRGKDQLLAMSAALGFPKPPGKSGERFNSPAGFDLRKLDVVRMRFLDLSK